VQIREHPRNATATVQVVGNHAGTAGQTVSRNIEVLLKKLHKVKDWTVARQTFTKETTALMWQKNPDSSRWVGAVCYNKGWHVKDTKAISDVVSIKLSFGHLHSDYNCLYIGHNNEFYTDGLGGNTDVSGPLPPEDYRKNWVENLELTFLSVWLQARQ